MYEDLLTMNQRIYIWIPNSAPLIFIPHPVLHCFDYCITADIGIGL